MTTSTEEGFQEKEWCFQLWITDKRLPSESDQYWETNDQSHSHEAWRTSGSISLRLTDKEPDEKDHQMYGKKKFLSSN